MNPHDLKQIFDFSLLSNKMKYIERFKGHYFWREYPEPARYDSNADHSWHLAMLVLLFSDKLSKPFNAEKGLKIALLHDMVEIYAGDTDPLGSEGTGADTHAFNKTAEGEKTKKEEAAAQKIFATLSQEKQKEFYELWQEYATGSSFEALVVKALDKIEATMQVIEWRDGEVFPEHLQFSIKYLHKYADVDPAIKEFTNLITEELKKRYKGFSV
ncbi:MAG: HD domain-containing protein [Candidatus Magasanikbacteria bacterium]|jgi:putative hydrolase of HD superfamily